MLAKMTGSLDFSQKVFSIVLLIQISPFAFGTEARPMEVDRCKVVLLGASYAKGWPTSGIGEFSITNKGIGGNQSFEMAERFHADVINQDAGAVIIWGFINDIFRTPQERLEDARQRILDSFSQMISLSRENGVIPIIATEVSIREPSGFANWIAGIVGRLRGKSSYQSMINGHVSETNADLQTLAVMHNVKVLDFYSVLSDEDGLRRPEFATPDGSHISAAGYAALTKYVATNFPAICPSSD